MAHGWRTSSLLGGTIPALLLLGLVQPALASHSSTTFPNLQIFPQDSIEWLVLDALPTGPDDNDLPRLVRLSFGLSLVSTGGTSAPLRIVANGQTLLDTSFSNGAPQAYPGVSGVDLFPAGTGSIVFTGAASAYQLDLFFPLFFVDPCCTDIFIEVQRPDFFGGDLFLQNIELDWSQPLPEPSTGALVGLGLIALGRARRRSGASRRSSAGP